MLEISALNCKAPCVMLGSFAELILFVAATAGLYFLFTPLRKRIEWKLGQWLRDKYGRKSERPVVDININKKRKD